MRNEMSPDVKGMVLQRIFLFYNIVLLKDQRLVLGVGDNGRVEEGSASGVWDGGL